MSESVRDVVRRPAPEAITIAGLAADHYPPAGEPDGPPLVIVHGAMDRAAGFRRTARHLPYRDIVAYDRRGYAGSRDVPPVREFATQVDDLVAVLTELIAANGDRRLVVGHSAGGLIERADAAGLVRRIRDDSDHRVIRLQLTDTGARRLESLTAAHLNELNNFAIQLPPTPPRGQVSSDAAEPESGR